MYNQQNSSFGSNPSAFSGGISQYQGFQRSYQPVGLVQSQYGQNQGQAQFASSSFQSSGAGMNSFHTANYHGNQPGHDNALRADSTNPTQSGSMFNQYGGMQNQSANQFHTANYRGNQPGHDNYLRSDSQSPAQSGYSSGSFGSSFGMSQFQPYNQSFNQSFQPTQSVQQSQNVSPQSFHTANYRGNQAGHDNSLRSDSQQPSTYSSFGSFGTSSFR